MLLCSKAEIPLNRDTTGAQVDKALLHVSLYALPLPKYVIWRRAWVPCALKPMVSAGSAALVAVELGGSGFHGRERRAAGPEVACAATRVPARPHLPPPCR